MSKTKWVWPKKDPNRPLILNWINKYVAPVDREGGFKWTQEFEDKIVSVRDVRRDNDGWSIVEFADGSKYVMKRDGWSLAYPAGEWPKKEPANPIGSHPDWEDYKADHIVGNEDNWDEEGEWNVFCADRNIG